MTMFTRSSKFFNAREIAPGTMMVTGLGMENCYLLEGSDSALLIDTLTGVGNLRAFCRELTDLPLTVANTHGHADHCGGNFDFGRCYIHPDDIPMMYEETSVEHRSGFVADSLARRGMGAAFTAADLHPPGAMATYPIYDGNVFDLGGRRIEVIGVPGHTFGTVVLLDRGLRVIFSGDACNANTLLSLPGSASVTEYLEGLKHFKRFSGAFDVLYGGHGADPVPSVIVDEAIDLCRDIINGEDDAVEGTPSDFPVFYGKRKDNAYRRDDGKLANIAYRRDNIQRPARSGVVRVPN